MPTINLTAGERAAWDHFIAQTAYGTPPEATPVSALLRAIEEIRPLGTSLDKLKAGIEASMANPMTEVGDLIVGDVSGAPAVLPAGATMGHVLTSNGLAAAPSWEPYALTLADLVDPVVAGAGAMLGVAPALIGGDPYWEVIAGGAEGRVLTAHLGALPTWEDPAGGGYAKLTESGANGGTLSQYDDTATVGLSQFLIRSGAGQGTNVTFGIYDADGTTIRHEFLANGKYRAVMPSSVNDYAVKIQRTATSNAVHLGDVGYGSGAAVGLYNGSVGGFQVQLIQTEGLGLASNLQISWNPNTTMVGNPMDVSLKRHGVGILRVGDGTANGYGRLLVGTLAVNNYVAGTTLGSVVGGVEVFNAAGASLGKLPIYNTIT